MYYNKVVNPILQNLNAEQKIAVQTTDGPLLVLSGAGTGKTRVLTTRVAYILNNGLAMPWQILALTFTNKAATEMKNRITAFADASATWRANDLWCGTFHSMCLRILHENATMAGLRRDFLVYGTDEQQAVLKSVFANMGLDAKDFKPSDWVDRISGIKDKGLNPDAQISEIGKKILDEYNAELARMSALDFGDIILKVLELFTNNPNVLAHYRDKFKYVLVDEFQDTNRAQMQFLELLTRDMDNPNICCVGDDDQSIYSWRGAEIKNILDFQKNYPGAKIIRLETNYRSTPNILGASNSLIRHNQGRLGKDLHSVENKTNGEPVYVLTVPTDWDEARLVADTILRKDAATPYSNFAVLIRAGSVSRTFEEEFTSRGLPYKLVGATKFYDRMEIRDAIAYLRLLVYPFDDMSLRRIISKPSRNIGPGTLAKIRTPDTFLMDGLRNAKLPARARENANAFLSAFDFDWQSMSPVAVANTLLEKSGYMNMWRESKDVDAPDRLDNIRELITNVISKYDTLPEFLEHAALMTTDDNDAEAFTSRDVVSIMTIHAAKGLEFDTVFLPAWEEGMFPNDKSISEGGLEEERRLAYVALTRAKRRAVIINAMSRMVFGQRQYNSPSRFITEMDNKFLDFQGGTSRTYNHFANSKPQQPVRHAPRADTMVGKLVAHNEMGHGTVIAQDGDVLTVAFGSRGMKKVLKEFLTVL